jgi:hypothetical protein
MKRVYGIVLAVLLIVVLMYSTSVVNAGAVEQITEQEFANRVQTYGETQLQEFFQSLASDEIEVLVSDPIETESWYVMLMKNVTDSEGNAIEGATVTITNPDDSWELYMKAAVPAGNSWETESATSVTDENGYCYFHIMWDGGLLSTNRYLTIDVAKEGFLASSETEIIAGMGFNFLPDEIAPYYAYNTFDNVLIPLPSHVVPEVPLGTVLASAAMIAALGLYITMPRRQRKQKALIS